LTSWCRLQLRFLAPATAASATGQFAMAERVSASIDWAALRAGHRSLAHLPAALGQSARRVPFAQGDHLFRLGERPGVILYVLSGEVHLLRRSRDGVEIILQRSRMGFLAEASLEAERYHCDAIAATPGEALRSPLRGFRAALAHDAAFRNGWMAHLSREVRRLRAQCERLNLRSAADRILHYIESEGSGGAVVLTHTKKAWAAELGLSHEALYRTLRRLRHQGTILVDGARVSRK